MKIILPVGFLIFALTFCGVTDRLRQAIGDGTDNGSVTDSTNDGDESSGGVDTPNPTQAQKRIQDDAEEEKWDDQGMSWRLPEGFTKMDVKSTSFNYGTPASGFLLVNISTMSADFPSEISLKATYDSSLEQLKNGKYESARYLEIDGVKGVEWIESMPEDKSDARRHQWIAFRNYQGQNQQLNVMLSTRGDEFDDKRDTFAAIMYSMKINK